jgi:hypothetical protein
LFQPSEYSLSCSLVYSFCRMGAMPAMLPEVTMGSGVPGEVPTLL